MLHLKKLIGISPTLQTYSNSFSGHDHPPSSIHPNSNAQCFPWITDILLRSSLIFALTSWLFSCLWAMLPALFSQWICLLWTLSLMLHRRLFPLMRLNHQHTACQPTYISFSELLTTSTSAMQRKRDTADFFSIPTIISSSFENCHSSLIIVSSRIRTYCYASHSFSYFSPHCQLQRLAFYHYSLGTLPRSSSSLPKRNFSL